MGKEEAFAQIKEQFRNSYWNRGDLDEALDADLDFEEEFKEASQAYLRKKCEQELVFQEYRVGFRNAYWNRGQLDGELDADHDFEEEFLEACGKYFNPVDI